MRPESLGRVAAKMTPQQIAQAKEISKRCQDPNSRIAIDDCSLISTAPGESAWELQNSNLSG